jgi:hippurate hydrolase
LGQVLVRAGATTAAVEILYVTIRGVAGHGALPHLAADPIVAASSVVMALQTAISRNNDALDAAVLTVGSIHGGSLATAIPETVELKIGIRTTSEQSRALLAKRVPEIIHAQAQSFGCLAEITPDDCVIYPVGYNDIEQATLVRDVALSFGQTPADIDLRGPFLFSEDFAFMLQKVPGCYFGIGNGPGKSLHDPGYDFNDQLLEKGVAFWAALVAKALPS